VPIPREVTTTLDVPLLAGAINAMIRDQRARDPSAVAAQPGCC